MVSSHRNTAAIEVLKRQFNCHEPFNVFRALKFRASQFAGSRPTDGEINSHFRRVAKMVHPDKIKVTSEYSFQQVSFARDALVEFGAWRPHDVLRAIRIYRCEDPPEGDTHCGMSSSEPVGPRSPPQGDSSSHVRDRSPVRGVPERCRRPYSYIDLTRNTAKKRPSDEAYPPKKRQNTGQTVNVRIAEILWPRPHEVEKYTWKRSQYSRAWCWVKSSEHDRIEVDRDYLLKYPSQLSIVVRVNGDWFTVVLRYDRGMKMFKGRDPIDGTRLEIKLEVMRDMMGGNTNSHVGYMY